MYFIAWSTKKYQYIFNYKKLISDLPSTNVFVLDTKVNLYLQDCVCICIYSELYNCISNNYICTTCILHCRSESDFAS